MLPTKIFGSWWKNSPVWWIFFLEEILNELNLKIFFESACQTWLTFKAGLPNCPSNGQQWVTLGYFVKIAQRKAIHHHSFTSHLVTQTLKLTVSSTNRQALHIEIPLKVKCIQIMYTSYIISMHMQSPRRSLEHVIKWVNVEEGLAAYGGPCTFDL